MKDFHNMKRQQKGYLNTELWSVLVHIKSKGKKIILLFIGYTQFPYNVF